MDDKEFYTEFNLAYNNLASNQAAGLDRVEISTYLSKAQNVVEDALYAEYEKSEEARRKLSTLVKTAKLNNANISSNALIYPDMTKCYSLTTDSENNSIRVRYIVNEQVKIKSGAKSCVKNQLIDIQPCLHDEVDKIVKNPYRFNIRRALRLDADNHVEVLYKNPSDIDYYQIRYIETPEPIMIYNTTDYPEYSSDSIEGVQPPTTGYRPASLPESTHRQIVEIAAKLAYQDYKQ